MQILLELIFLLILFFPSNERIFYVDNQTGNDQNSGLSQTAAWKSIRKVNDFNFKPGDKILFNKNNYWNEMLVPSISGTKDKPIIYSSYGNGKKPVISTKEILPNSSRKDFWIKLNDSVFFGKTGIMIDRLWINNMEFDKAKDFYQMNEKNKWHYDKKGKILYIFERKIPVEKLKIEIAGGIDRKFHTVKIVDTDNLIFRELDIQGGYTATIGLAGADNIIFEDCNIGKYSQGRGIIGNQLGLKAKDATSDSIIIRRDTIDSGWQIYANYNRSGMDGISIQNGANNWKVYENYFKNWDHSAVQVYGYKAEAKRNKIFKNIVTAPDIAFGRAFESVGTAKGMCSENEFFQNRISRTTARNQFGGDNNKIYYNIFEHMKNSTVPYGNQKTAQAIVLAAVDGPSEENLIANNTIYNIEREGIWDYGNDNLIVNNLIINAGRTILGVSFRVSKNVKGTKWQNNLVYIPEKNHNYIINFKEKRISFEQFKSIEDNVRYFTNNNIRFTGNLDELIKTPEDGNYSPAENSPLIDAGINVGLKEDFYGNPIKGKPDIGAIEFTGN